MVFKLISRRKSTFSNCFYTTQALNKKKVYSNTLLLPKTNFPIRLEGKKLVERDKEISSTIDLDKLYKWQQSHLSEPEFVLHDGPPYANGKLHMGHAVNKILKDTILRYHILKGCKVHFVPGWDCHGLPIELKALTKSENAPLEIRCKARNFAKNTIQDQMQMFKSWGIVGNWNKHYATFNADYVKTQLKIFNKLYQKKLIYRDVKPIYWSPSSKTALAEAELEYNEKHISKSTFVRIKMNHIPGKTSDRTYALIWTTTPWTLPANQAICYNPTLTYSLVKMSNDNNSYLIASETIDKLSETLNCTISTVDNVGSDVLSQCTYIHPVYKEKTLGFLPASHVTSAKGTGLVHTAPAHGPDDFLVALTNKISIENLVDECGCYNANSGTNLQGKFVLTDGTDAVLETIKDDIVHLHDFEHSYPYDWRTKKPVIIRASRQWFVDTETIKNRAIELLEDIEILPKIHSQVYKRNFANQIKNRPYWCISRQRKWGVPIPVFFNKTNENILIDENLVRHYCCLIDKHGTDFWWELPLEQLVPVDLRQEIQIDDIEKGEDILDIWFDSGISWANALEGDKIADLYLEGVDQFTGWFQSSLLTSVALRDKAPYKSIYVHGFVVDEDGDKMSKSLGNVVNPQEIVVGNNKKKPYGVDALRWWVACHANQDSLAHISSNVLQACSDELNKIRNALRFALGCLNDYQTQPVDYNALSLLDKYVLHLLYSFHDQTQQAVDNYQFQQICKSMIYLLTNQISSVYYTAIKDRLYCDNFNATSRKSSQFVLMQIVEVFSQAIAGIVPHLVEEIFQHLPQKDNKKSFFVASHSKPELFWKNAKVDEVMNILLSIRKDINKEAGNKSNEMVARVVVSDQFRTLFAETATDFHSELSDIFQVSEVHLSFATLKSTYELEVSKSKLFMCDRCRCVKSKHENHLCERCNLVVTHLENKAAVA